MKAFLILLLLSAGPVLSQTGKEVRSPEPYTVEPPVADPPSGQEIYTVVEEPAEFPGGQGALMAFLKDNLKFPQAAWDRYIEGRCYLKFVVNADGTIADIKILRGVTDCPECDQEAMRVIQMMPKWKPGKHNGKAVKSYFTLPVKFTNA